MIEFHADRISSLDILRRPAMLSMMKCIKVFFFNVLVAGEFLININLTQIKMSFGQNFTNSGIEACKQGCI